MKNQKGVSLIALVITIIVVIILAAIAFNSSTSTIEKANYSKFVSNIGEVRDAFKKSATEFKGDQAAIGNEITDAQAYNTVAEGSGDILPLKDLKEYTIIKEAKAKDSIGIELPAIKVNTPGATNVKVTYAVTTDGEIFVWPPYKYDGKYYLNDTLTVTNYDADATAATTSQAFTSGKTLTINGTTDGPLQDSAVDANIRY